METRTTLFWHKELALAWREGQPLTVRLQDGDRAVVLVKRQHPGAQHTYDTGLVEELYLEFKGPPAVGEVLDARQVLSKAFYQFGSVVLAYQSNTFAGTVRVDEWTWGARVAGRCCLEFTFPILNRVDAKAVPIEADFS